MKLGLHRAWLVAGLAAVLCPVGTPVVAQSSAPASIGSWPTLTQPTARAPEARPAQAPPPAAPEAPVVPMRRIDPVMTEPPPALGELAEPEASVPLDSALDGPTEVLDGLAGETEELPREDAEAFVIPEAVEAPAGYDPSVFSIEPDPMLDRRPARLAALDPYLPVGIRVGTFLLFPEIEIGAAAFDNVFRTSVGRRADQALDARPALRAVSTWSVHALELDARGTTSFHNQFPGEDDRGWAVDARGRVDITRRTNIEAGLAREVTQETRGSINTVSGAGARADIVSDRLALAFNHRFNRLSIQLRGTLTERDYAATVDPTGVVVSNSERDLTRREAALRASWSFTPALAIFGEAGIEDRTYGAASVSDGLKRDSSGERYRAGVAFERANLRGEIAVGAAHQRFDEAGLPTIGGIVVDANVGWRLSGLTSLLLTAQSSIGDSTVAGSGGALVRSGGAELRHAFRRHLVGSAGVRLTRADYVGIDLVEQDVTLLTGLEYFLSREVTLFARYQHVDFQTTAPGSDYAANEVRLGVRLRR